MPVLDVVRSTPIPRSPRVLQVEGIFDVPPAERSVVKWSAEIPIEEREWNVGLVVGPSGAGKSTVARELFGDNLIDGYPWPEDESVLDAFAPDLSVKEITASLTSVGLGSVPSWLRPYHVLSTGEKFRATMARALAEAPDPIVVDEFTSVVDRQVARVASHAVAKAVRKKKRRFVAVSCHYDIIDWLQPDWVFEPHSGQFQWRCLQRRPEINVQVYRVSHKIWSVFRHHHYMSGALHKAAKCFGAFVDGRCIGFVAYLHFPHSRVRNIKMGHRTVVLPEWQGLGLGGRLLEWVGCRLYKQRYRFRVVASHPAIIAYFNKSPRWFCARKPSRMASTRKAGTEALAIRAMKSARRMTATFEYVPPADSGGLR